jgi:hypothetical protein
MAGSITVSSITLDSDNNFSIRSNTGATILSANGTGLITGIASGSAITNAQLTSPTVSGNLSFDATGTSGVRLPAANTLTFHTAGTEDVRIDSAGNVGIGITNPSSKLDVLRASTNTARFDEPQIRAINSGSATINQGIDIAMRFQDGTYNGTGGISMVRESATARSGALTFSPIASDGNGAERMRINSNGQVTTPFQPAFSAFRDAGSVPGTTSSAVIVFNNATFSNVGSHYNTSTGRFTAPVAGTYYFSFSGMLDSSPNNAGDLQMKIRKNGADFTISNPPMSGASIQGMGFAMSGAISLAASDYVDVAFYASNDSSRLYANGGVFNNFSGFLIG